MPKRATQTREMELLTEFFRRISEAYRTGDFGPVDELIDPDVVLRTQQGERQGVAAVTDFLKAMGKERWKGQIVAPKGGLVTVLISPVTSEGGWGRGHEQVYRIHHDKLVELIDLGRTPDMVYRPGSQPN